MSDRIAIAAYLAGCAAAVPLLLAALPVVAALEVARQAWGRA